MFAVIGRPEARSPHPSRGGATGAVCGGVGGAGHRLPPRSCRRRLLSGRPRWRSCCSWRPAPGGVCGALPSRAVTVQGHTSLRDSDHRGEDPSNQRIPPQASSPFSRAGWGFFVVIVLSRFWPKPLCQVSRRVWLLFSVSIWD